jgi:hypothetical protein
MGVRKKGNLGLLLQQVRATLGFSLSVFECDHDHFPKVPDVKKALSQHKVRTSIQDRTLDAMFPVTPHHKDSESTPPSAMRSKEIVQSDCALSSVKELRQAVEEGKHHRAFARFFLFFFSCVY